MARVVARGGGSAAASALRQGEKILVDREKNQPVGREAAAGRSEGTKPQLVVTCALVVLVDPSCRVR